MPLSALTEEGKWLFPASYRGRGNRIGSLVGRPEDVMNVGEVSTVHTRRSLPGAMLKALVALWRHLPTHLVANKLRRRRIAYLLTIALHGRLVRPSRIFRAPGRRGEFRYCSES